MEGAKQPYHFAESLSLEQAEHHLHKCSEAPQRLALKAVREMLEAVTARNYRVVGCAVLLASGRALPSLQKNPSLTCSDPYGRGGVLSQDCREACEHCRILVAGIRERELNERANETFGKAAARVREHISSLAKTVGSPWTQDE
jgi:hypothetical protein